MNEKDLCFRISNSQDTFADKPQFNINDSQLEKHKLLIHS